MMLVLYGSGRREEDESLKPSKNRIRSLDVLICLGVLRCLCKTMKDTLKESLSIGRADCARSSISVASIFALQARVGYLYDAHTRQDADARSSCLPISPSSHSISSFWQAQVVQRCSCDTPISSNGNVITNRHHITS